MSVFWIPVISIVGGIGFVMLIVIAGATTRQQKQRLRAEVQMKLIERFGTAEEFVKFVQSEEGKQFLSDAPQVARRGYLGGVRTGIIMTGIGAGFTVLGAIEDHDWFVPAFIVLGIGLGFFVSAMVSMRLAKNLDENDRLGP